MGARYTRPSVGLDHSTRSGNPWKVSAGSIRLSASCTWACSYRASSGTTASRFFATTQQRSPRPAVCLVYQMPTCELSAAPAGGLAGFDAGVEPLDVALRAERLLRRLESAGLAGNRVRLR